MNMIHKIFGAKRMLNKKDKIFFLIIFPFVTIISYLINYKL